MKFIVNIIVLFCLFSLCFTQISPYCANDRQCNYQASYGLSYCESSSGTCKQRSNVTFKSVLTSNQFACGPDSFSRTGVCIQLAGDNCQYSVLNSIYYQCFGTYNALQGVCTPFTSTDKMSSLNNRCDLNSNPKVVCPLGQYCNNQICRPNIPVGGYCTTQASPLITSNMCAYPSICNRRKCILPYTVPVGGSCESSTACANGVCLNGVCSQATQNPCFNNDDCASYETCPQPTNTDNKGTCTTKILQATLDYNSCLYNKCTSVYGTTETDCIAANCTSEYIRRGCATYCNQHPSVRYDTSYGQFTYYCKDIKRTAWTAPACSQQQESQFTQCEGNSY